MPISHVCLAVLVATIWGINFLFIKLGLEELSPFLLCAVRFVLASIPAIFFVKPPAVPFRVVVLYGLVMFALQFSLLFFGMQVGMTAGMASLILQVQIFFSMFLAAIWLNEIPTFWQILGALVSFAGIGVVALHIDNNVSLAGFLLLLAASATWGCGNLITKKINNVNILALIIWGSLVASIPLFILALLFEGPASILASFQHITIKGVSAVLYIVYASTWIGYGVWNWLLSRYPVSSVVPFTLLVPVVGMLSSSLILGEPFQPWKGLAALLVISGLCINIFGARFFIKKIEPDIVN